MSPSAREGSGFSWRILGAVVLGGAIGVLVRALIVIPISDIPGWIVVPAVTLAVNVAGSFLLGLLAGRIEHRRPVLRAFVGTGILGGFTTYSAFALQVAQVGALAPVTALILAGVAVLLGLFAAGLGLRIGRGGQPVHPEEAQ